MATDPSASMSVRDDIYEFFESLDLELPANLHDQTLLFELGVLDSVALFSLVMWVEEQVGHPIDPSCYDLGREWATVDAIVLFIASDHDAGRTTSLATAPARPLPPTPDGCRIIRYEPGYKQQIAQLQTNLWSPDPGLNARYFDWLYEHNPYADDVPFIYLALEGTELVGMRGFWASQWIIGSEEVPILVADDLVVRPSRRNRGIHRRLMEAAFDDLADTEYTHAFNLSGSPVNVLASLGMGWQRSGLLEMMGTRADGAGMFAILREVMRKAPFIWRYADAALLRSPAGTDPFRSFDRGVGGERLTGNDLTLSAEPRIDAIAELIARQPHNGGIQHVRDSAYLTWRFQNPRTEYRYIYAGGAQLDGYVVLSRPVSSRRLSHRVFIADIEAVDHATYCRLLDAANRHCGDLGAWTATLSADALSALQTRGFEPIDAERRARGCPTILVRPLANGTDWTLNGKSLIDMQQWDIRMLYSMSV